MRERGGTAEADMEAHQAVGMKTARVGMKYVAAAAAVLVAVYLVAYSGAIPVAGYVVLGVLLNVAHLATAIGIGVLLVLTLSLTVLPSYVMDGAEEAPLEEMLSSIRRGRDSILKVPPCFPRRCSGSWWACLGGQPWAPWSNNGPKECPTTWRCGRRRAAEVNATLASDSVEFADWSRHFDQPAVQRRAAPSII